MGLFGDILEIGLDAAHVAREISDINKVNNASEADEARWNFYLWHSQTHLSLIYTEAYGACGYACFGIWCRMKGYWNAAYQYLKIAAHDGSLRSRAEFARVCFLFEKYEEAIEAGNRYQYFPGWQPSFYMALSYYMLGDTQKCKELLTIIEQSKIAYSNEASLARGFLQSEFGVVFEKKEAQKGFWGFLETIENGGVPYSITPVDRNTAFSIASELENTATYDAQGYKVFNNGAVNLFDPEIPDNGYTYHFRVKIDKWVKELPDTIKWNRDNTVSRLTSAIATISGVELQEFIEDCRYLFNLQYDPQNRCFVEVPRLVPSMYEIDKISELINS